MKVECAQWPTRHEGEWRMKVECSQRMHDSRVHTMAKWHMKVECAQRLIVDVGRLAPENRMA